MREFRELIDRILKGYDEDVTEQQKQTDLEEIKKVSSIAAAAVSFQPIPLIDTALISPIQIGMVQGIARVHGFSLDKRAILEMLSTFGASILAQNAVMAASKLLPFAGWIVSVSMAYALTYAIGEASDHYFASGRGMSKDELKEMFDRVYKQKKKEKQAQHKDNASLKDKLEQLKEARAADLIDDEIFEEKKAEILKSF